MIKEYSQENGKNNKKKNPNHPILVTGAQNMEAVIKAFENFLNIQIVIGGKG